MFTGVDWGTSGVMNQTHSKAETASLDLAELEPLWDIDRPEDYNRAIAQGALCCSREFGKTANNTSDRSGPCPLSSRRTLRALKRAVLRAQVVPVVHPEPKVRPAAAL